MFQLQIDRCETNILRHGYCLSFSAFLTILTVVLYENIDQILPNKIHVSAYLTILTVVLYENFVI